METMNHVALMLIVGPPGSGKSTQARRLAERLALVHLSPGALFREMATEDSPLGHRIGDLLARGELVPDAVTDRVLAERLKALPAGHDLCWTATHGPRPKPRLCTGFWANSVVSSPGRSFSGSMSLGTNCCGASADAERLKAAATTRTR